MLLFYDYNTATQAQFNGNIGSISWKSQHFLELKQYDFTYDGLNRLNTAAYANNEIYTTSIKYYYILWLFFPSFFLEFRSYPKLGRRKQKEQNNT